MKFIDQLKAQIVSNPYTSFLAMAGTVGLLWYSKVMTPGEIVRQVFTILIAASAADGNRPAELTESLKQENDLL